MNARVPFTTAVLIWATATAPARADAPTAANVAQVLFEQAREDMKRGAYPQACPKLAESQRLDPSSGTLLNLVLCEQTVGKVASAWLHARELLDVLPGGDMRRPIAERQIALLSPRVPRLSIHLVSPAPAGTRVALDGVDLGAGSLGVPVPVDPGPHSVVVTAPGRSDRSEQVSLEEGRDVEWMAQPGPEAGEAPPRPEPHASSVPPSPPPPVPVHPSHWDRWTAFGIGAAGLVASGILGALALDRHATVLSDCPSKQCRDASTLAAADEGQQFFVGSMTALAVGAAGMGVGTYLVVRGDPRPAAGAAAPSGVPRGVMVTLGFDL